MQTLRRSFASRRLGAYGARRLNAQLQSDEKLARVLARQIPSDARHLIVAQSLLPFLWREGVLGGRSFDVLMTRMPLGILHRKLDAALKQFPDRNTLGEFRAPQQLADDENAALESASRIVTAHSAIAALFGDRAEKLDWRFPDEKLDSQLNFQAGGQSRRENFTIFFPGPTAARKGAYELRDVARALSCEIILAGSDLEGEDFWRGVRTRRLNSGENWRTVADAVVQTALIEDNPRALLSALAAKVPVVASAACGLDAHPNLYLVPENDAAALIEVLNTLREL